MKILLQLRYDPTVYRNTLLVVVDICNKTSGTHCGWLNIEQRMAVDITNVALLCSVSERAI